MSRFNPWPWIRPFLVLVLVISIPPLIYWFGYVQHSVDQAQRQAYVTISAVTTDFRTRLAAYNQIAENAERLPQNDAAHLREYLRSLIQATPIRAGGDTAAMHLEVSPTEAGLRLHAAPSCAAGADCSTVSMSVPLENLVSWDVVESVFDGLLVVNEHGALVAQDRRLATQPAGMPIAMSSNARAALHSIFGDSMPTGENAESEAKKSDPPIFRSPLDLGDAPAIDIAGVRYVAFIQAVSVHVTPVGGKEAPKDAVSTVQLAVIGLIQADELRHAALQLAPQVLVAVGSLVTLGFFTIPFLKLRFIGARERMRVRDIWLLAGSMLAAVVLVVLGILQIHADERLRHRFDGSLKRFTGSIQRHISVESNLAREQLASIAPALTAGDLSCATVAAKSPTARAVGGVFSSDRDFDYPAFEAVFATDGCGVQALKWMARTIPTPNIDVGSERYFNAAVTLPDSGGCTRGSTCPSQYAFSSLIAPTSGLLLGVFATPASKQARAFGSSVPYAERSGIVALATPLHSVNAPVVAYPFQFVLVDESGGLMFQRAQGPFRGERFFDAVSGGATLQRSALRHEDLITDHTYRGKQYRMLSKWVPDLHATLVTYYDYDEIGTISSRVFTTAGIAALGIIASILIGAALARRIFGETALDWAWPAPGRTPYHWLGIGGGAALIGVFLIAHLTLSAGGVASVFLFAPAVAMLIAGSPYMVKLTANIVEQRLGLKQEESAADRRWPAIVAFESFAIVSIVAFVVVPTLVVYEDAFALHSAAYQEVVERRYAAAVTKQDAEMAAHSAQVATALSPPDCSGGGARDTRCTGSSVIYYREPNFRRYAALKETLSRYPECVDPSGEINFKCDASQQTAVPWSFTLGLAFRIAQMNTGNPELIQALNYFRSQRPIDTSRADLYDVRLSPENVGGFAILLAALLLYIGSISRHVLGLGVTNDGVLDGATAFTPENRTRWLLLRPPPEFFGILAARSGALATYDLRDRDCQRDVISALNPVTNEVILVRHIEARLEDADWRDSLLALIGNPKAGCVVLTSDVDPFHFLAQRLRELKLVRAAGDTEENAPGEDAAYEKSRAELTKWASALSSVRKVRYAPCRFDEPKPEHLSEESYAVIVRECGASGPLIEIGRQILRSADLTNHDPEEIVSFVQDAAEPYYRAIWDLSSREEKLVMIQLAQEGLVNPRSIELVQRLARRRLLVVNPKFSLMNESFRRFVRNAESPERIADWERASPGLSWSRLGTPLYAFAAIVIAILLFTQQGMVTSILAMATGAAGTLGSLRGLYAAVKPGGSGAKVA